MIISHQNLWPYAKPKICDGCNGCSVGSASILHPSRKARRTTPKSKYTRGNKRHFLSSSHGMFMENASEWLSRMAGGVLLFSKMEEKRNLEKNSWHASWKSSKESGKIGATDSGHHWFTVGKNDWKRGIRGYDAGKKVNGRKRHILVDTLGLILAVIVHSAHIQDRDGAKFVFGRLKKYFETLLIIWADGGYAGKLIEYVKDKYGWTLEIIKRSDATKGFKILPKRWIVERTFGWFNRYRRLSKDYEFDPKTSEAMIYIAMIHIMVRRLA